MMYVIEPGEPCPLCGKPNPECENRYVPEPHECHCTLNSLLHNLEMYLHDTGQTLPADPTIARLKAEFDQYIGESGA